jgi:hypothetical protein
MGKDTVAFLLALAVYAGSDAPVQDFNGDKVPDVVVRENGRNVPLYGRKTRETIEYVPAEEILRLVPADYHGIERKLNPEVSN